ncbi:MAG: WD40/YVTN/BNR-like repeat-containing protein, partial [Vicinamibacterales bacterium]
MTFWRFGAALAAAAAATLTVRAQAPTAFNEDLLKTVTYRNIGPFWIGARASDIAVPAAPEKDHLYTFYVSFWSGGVWKTTNNGTTFTPVFDAQNNLNVGAVRVAPSDENIVWVGTGDGFTSRSSMAGNGVYKSTDAGKTWTNMGLRDSQHIARIVIHPANPDIVYAAAMGHLYSENDERGVFRTTDGGRTWKKVLYENPNVGAVDLVMNPKNPNVLYAAMYDKTRLPWQLVPDGPGSGIYKTTDGGDHWTRLTGGLPQADVGRIGLDIYLKNPEILYAVVENDNPRGTPVAGQRGARPPGVQSVMGGEVYRTDDGGTTWKKMNADDYDVSPKGPYYFN